MKTKLDRESIRREVISEMIEAFRLSETTYNQRQLCSRLGISYNTLRKLIDEGAIPVPAHPDGKWTELQVKRMQGINI